jgi:biopolymer transport protein ExbB
MGRPLPLQADMSAAEAHNIWGLVASGGFAMVPLLLCSLAIWVVIFERLWSFRKLGRDLRPFHLEALNAVIRGDAGQLRELCRRHPGLPTSQLVLVALDRRESRDPRLRATWREAQERSRQLANQELRRFLWILGTIGSSAPFIGLFGTVIGILRSFQDMARTGSGGFAIVAAGISESLVATAAGIVVAVIAVVAYNAFQTHWNTLVLRIRVQTEELAELLESLPPSAEER